MRILLVEDDRLLGDGVKAGLCGAGFAVDWVRDGEAALAAVAAESFAAIVLDGLDGLILTGGLDVQPELYGAERHPTTDPARPDRDAWELALLAGAQRRGMPVFGICRGLQLINVALGGTLFQDIATQVETAGPHVHADYDRHSHAIEWAADSGFAKLYPGVTSGDVVSIHHQSINALGRGLRVEARSTSDGIIEAIRLEGRPYVLGVQWHPEFHPPGSPTLMDCTPILDEFLNAARGRRW